MLKFIKHYAETIQGISIYPVISLIIFVLFFIGVLYYVRKMDRQQVDEASFLPLETSNDAIHQLNAKHQA